MEDNQTYTVYDPVYDYAWVCCVPKEMISSIMSSINREGLEARPTSKHDIKNKVSIYGSGDWRVS